MPMPPAPSPQASSTPSASISTRLGWVAFLNDCAGEVLSRMLPLYLVAALGSSPALVGVVEGVAESAAVFLKGLSGWLSDRVSSRKGFVVGGYALSVLGRALYLLTFTPALVGAARVLERVGKGLRTAPRDAMIADAALQGRSGRDFGVTRFLDTLGAMAGIGLALAFGVGRGPMTAAVFRTCVWLALPLGLATVALLVFWVPRIPRATSAARRLSWHVPREARGYLAIIFLFALANSSDAFLVLRAREAGFSIRQILAVFLVFNLMAAALALPVGRLSDRLGRVPFLLMGWTVYGATYAVMGTTASPGVFAAALLAYGAFYGFTEGVEKALLADLLPPESRGTGFGALQSVLGLGALLSSAFMGVVMTVASARTAFLAEGSLALAAMLALAAWARLRVVRSA
jgi:MFS family permease